jgi:GT2 family glycosyltransferase/glycosyltransferase involved in cell wall biosynthesis
MQIFVLGMHRSGTSVVTRLINLMGAYFGPQSASTGANPENPKGFWERRDVRDENDALLWAAGADWWKVADFSLDRLPDDAVERFNTNVPEILRDLEAHRPWVVKEPRFCLLFPMWKHHVETPVCVLVHRSPVQVAHSLQHRNGFPLSFAIALWERYVRDALSASAGLPRIIVSYDEIMSDPPGQANRLLQHLRDAGVKDLRRLSEKKIASFISADLFRQRQPAHMEPDLLNPAQLDLANAMANGAALDFQDGPALSDEAAQTLRLFEEVCETSAGLEETGELDKRLEADDDESPARWLGLQRTRTERNFLFNHVATLQSEVGRIEKRLEDSEKALRRAEQKNQALAQEIENLQTVLKLEKERVRETLRSNAEMRTTIDRLEGKLADWRDAATNAESRKRELEHLSAELLVSLRRAQEIFHDILDEHVKQVGPVELRSRRKSTVHRSRMERLLTEIGESVRRRRSELVAMIGQMAQETSRPQSSEGEKATRTPSQLVPPADDRPEQSKMAVAPSRRAERGPETGPPDGSREKETSAEAKAIDASKRRRFAVYTAVSGGYDQLKAPQYVSPSVDYICFADHEIENSGVWQQRCFDYLNVDPTRTARFVKLHPHIYLSEYKASMWLDANLWLKGNPDELFDLLADQPIIAFTHPHRNCIYDEAREIIDRGGLDDERIVLSQMERYRAAGFPEKFGLVETNILIRRHNDRAVRDLMTLWWAEILNGSRRDQLSFNYTLWRTASTYQALAPKGVSVRNDPRFERFLHGRDSKYREGSPSRVHLTRSEEVRTPLNAYGMAAGTAETTAEREPDLNMLSLDVIVCVHNSLDDVRRCLRSVISTLGDRHKLIIVDDGSGEETADFLRRFAAAHNRVDLIRRKNASGYTKAANRGLRKSTADFVILLNSDTQVPKTWLKKLVRAAYSSPDIGIVGPLSNAASWQSVPDILDPTGQLAVNKVPAGLTLEDMDLMAESFSPKVLPRVDLANGFCLGIKREVTDRIGLFDEDSFPRGYGEENDFCFRAADAGFGIVVASDCYVFHEKSKSYTAARRDELALDGSKALRQMYPASRIGNAVESCKKNPSLVAIREYFRNRVSASVHELEESRQSRFALRTIDNASGSVLPSVARQPGFFDLSGKCLATNRRIVETYLGRPRAAPRQVLWFVPAFTHVLRGGIRTIFSVAEDFSKCWGTKNLFALYGHVKGIDIDALRKSIIQYFGALEYDLLTVDDGQDPSTLPEADVAFCTLWTSAYLLAKYNKCQGKFYFVQDFEPSFYRAGSTYGFVEGTYRLGFPVIANSLGVAQKVRRRSETVGYFTPGVDRSTFYPGDGAVDGDIHRVVFYGRPGNPRNAFELGIAALREVKHRLGNRVQIISAGADFDPRDHGLHGLIENWGVLGSMQDVADLYRSSSVGLVFMFSAHPSYQPLEFMACGCATVTNWNPCTSWLLKHRRNALLVDPLMGPVANAIVELLEDSDLRATIVENGLNTVRGFEWRHAYSRIRDFVLDPRAHGLPDTANASLDDDFNPSPDQGNRKD